MALWHIDCKFQQPRILSFVYFIIKVKVIEIFALFDKIVYLLLAYDKLAMYGLRVHGCIDGASHYVLYAKVASDKKQETILEPFRRALERFGAPLRVRSDFASEHTLIRQFMEEARPHTRNPFLVGSSVHNQVKYYLHMLC